MPITPAIRTQIEAIQARIDAIAPNATAEDIIMLAKAVDAIAGHVTVFDIISEGEAQVAAIEGSFDANIASGISQITTATTSALSDVNIARQAALAEINPDNFSLAVIQANSLIL